MWIVAICVACFIQNHFHYTEIISISTKVSSHTSQKENLSTVHKCGTSEDPNICIPESHVINILFSHYVNIQSVNVMRWSSSACARGGNQTFDLLHTQTSLALVYQYNGLGINSLQWQDWILSTYMAVNPHWLTTRYGCPIQRHTSFHTWFSTPAVSIM